MPSERSAEARAATDRPDIDEGSTVPNGTTLLEIGVSWARSRWAVRLTIEGALAAEWFDPRLAGEAFLSRKSIARPDMEFSPPGMRKVALVLEWRP